MLFSEADPIKGSGKTTFFLWPSRALSFSRSEVMYMVKDVTTGSSS